MSSGGPFNDKLHSFNLGVLGAGDAVYPSKFQFFSVLNGSNKFIVMFQDLMLTFMTLAVTMLSLKRPPTQSAES